MIFLACRGDWISCAVFYSAGKLVWSRGKVPRTGGDARIQQLTIITEVSSCRENFT